MQFPSQKIHRVARRHMGRGQYRAPAAVATFTTAAGAIATITFTRPVIVKGPVNLSVPGFSALSQTIITPTQLTISFNADITGQPWTLPTPPTNVAASYGGQVFGGSGIFDAAITEILHATNIAGGAYTLTFNTQVTNNSPGTPEAERNVIMYSPTHTAWDRVVTNAQSTGNAINVTTLAGYTDCTRVAILDTPTQLTSTLPWQLASPRTQIPAWNPPPAPAAITHFHSRGFGALYNVRFSQPITINALGAIEPQLLTWNPSNQLWTAAQVTGAAGPGEIQIVAGSAANNDQLVILVDTPTVISAPMGFTPAAPIERF